MLNLCWRNRCQCKLGEAAEDTRLSTARQAIFNCEGCSFQSSARGCPHFHRESNTTARTQITHPMNRITHQSGATLSGTKNPIASLVCNLVSRGSNMDVDAQSALIYRHARKSILNWVLLLSSPVRGRGTCSSLCEYSESPHRAHCASALARIATTQQTPEVIICYWLSHIQTIILLCRCVPRLNEPKRSSRYRK